MHEPLGEIRNFFNLVLTLNDRRISFSVFTLRFLPVGNDPEYVALGEVGDLSCLNCDRLQELLRIVVLFGVLVIRTNLLLKQGFLDLETNSLERLPFDKLPLPLGLQANGHGSRR